MIRLTLQPPQTDEAIAMTGMICRTTLQPSAIATALARTGHLIQCRLQSAIAAAIASSGIALAWYQRITDYRTPSRTTVASAVAVMPTQSTGAMLGETSVTGTTITRSGSHIGELRYTSWAADHATTLSGVAGGSAVYTHNLATTNHITQVMGDGGGLLGEVWVEPGSNSDTIHWSGSFAGDLKVAAIKGVNPKCVAQYDYVVDGSGKFIAAAADTLPLAVARLDTNAQQGELYAVRESGGWRIHRTGSANISTRIAILNLI